MEATIAPGWLREELDAAHAEFITWPQWQRDMAAAMMADLNRPDPCHCPRRCDVAQTCVGGCIYANHRARRSSRCLRSWNHKDLSDMDDDPMSAGQPFPPLATFVIDPAAEVAAAEARIVSWLRSIAWRTKDGGPLLTYDALLLAQAIENGEHLSPTTPAAPG